MAMSYIKLGIAASFPVIVAVAIRIFEQGKQHAIPEWLRQLTIGIIFGGIAIVGTEWGIPLEGAMVNCRDAAPMVAGLLFGAPAGVVAGFIGGVERWIAVAWGVGAYTRVACSVSTCIAGIYAGLLRKFMFDNKRPSWPLALGCGIVMEMFHLSMVFLTHMDDADKAMNVVRICTVPMVIANGLSVMFAAMLVTIVDHEKLKIEKEHLPLSQSIQKYMLFAVLIVLFAMSYFSFSLHQQMADGQTDLLLNTTLSDIQLDLVDASDNSMYAVAVKVKDEVAKGRDLASIADEYDISEISIVNKKGIITDSTGPEYIGFDMNSGEQSSEFLCLLMDENVYIQPYGPISSDPTLFRKYAGIATNYGFVQIGYDAARFQRDIGSSVKLFVQNRHIGKEGYLAVMGSNGSFVSSPSLEIEKDVKTILTEWKVGHDTDSVFRATINEQDMFYKVSDVEGYYIVACYPVEEAFSTRNVALYANSYMYILTFGAMFAMIYALIKGLVVSRLNKVGHSLERISEGDLSEVVNIRSNEEFAVLSDNINTTVDALKGYIDEAAARIDADLATAKTIQESVLPQVFSRRKDYDAYAMMNTAKEVGGDFYDFYQTHKNTLNFLIADVSGKGIPAAMFMMRGKTELKGLTETDIPVSEVFEKGNTVLCEGNGNGMFITAWQGQIDLATGLVKYANAGHNPPVVMHAGGDFEYLRSKVNLVLAGMEGVPYKLQELQLNKGDIIYLYTDGVTEATDANNELYGEDRLLACLNAHKGNTVKEICDFVMEDVNAFVKDAPQFDDITMLCFKYIGKPESPKISFDIAKLEDIPPITEFIEEKLMAMGCPMKAIIAINIAVDELYSNIVKYGYAKNPGPASVVINEVDEPHGVEICFIDEGVPYNPIKAEDPDTTLSAEEREIGGLGIFMVKKSMDEMSYEYKNSKNILKIRKNF